MAKTGVNIDDDVLAAIDSGLSYGDSRSAWFQHAARMRLQVDPILDELFEPEDTQKRIHFVEMAVKKEAEKVKENPDYEGPDGDYSY